MKRLLLLLILALIHTADAADADGSQQPTVQSNAQASALTAFAIGRLQRYARSGFKRSPTEHLDAGLRLFV